MLPPQLLFVLGAVLFSERAFVIQGRDRVTPYAKDVELAMVTFFCSLREKDRRRYAAVEAGQTRSGGVPYLAQLLGIDPRTIRQGQADLRDLPDVPPENVRKKGAAESG